jgi:hypothetical protein
VAVDRRVSFVHRVIASEPSCLCGHVWVGAGVRVCPLVARAPPSPSTLHRYCAPAGLAQREASKLGTAWAQRGLTSVGLRFGQVAHFVRDGLSFEIFLHVEEQMNWYDLGNLDEFQSWLTKPERYLPDRPPPVYTATRLPGAHACDCSPSRKPVHARCVRVAGHTMP